MTSTYIWHELIPSLLWGFLKVTLVTTVAASIIAALLGLIWAFGQRELPRPLSALLGWLLGVVRMTPIPLQLIFVQFAIATPTGWLAHTSSLDQLDQRLAIIGIAVFSVHYSTYMAESYRAGIDSIRAGQWEAATALSLPRGRTWRAVIIPQALRATLPSLGNWAIAMFKDTPYLIVLGVPELVSRAKQAGGEYFSYTIPILLAGLIFLVASYPTAILMRRLEKKLAY